MEIARRSQLAAGALLVDIHRYEVEVRFHQLDAEFEKAITELFI